ncbi:MAG: SIMPL domain-containing protein [Elusimicrobiota bacterium]|jgi:hypothetical protein
MNRVRVWHVVLISGCVALGTLAQAEPGDGRENLRTISVQGQGRLTAVPDIANLTVEVRKEGASLDDISAQVRQGMSHVLDVLKGQGLADKDLQTAAYQVQPRYEHDRQGNTRPNGYIVLNRLTAKVRDLKKVGKVLTAAVQSGATGVTGPDFDFDNPQLLERKALALAMEDARAKADVLVQAAGARLGAVRTVNQSGPIAWPGRHFMASRAMEVAGAAEPIAAGEQGFTSTIQVTFDLQ